MQFEVVTLDWSGVISDDRRSVYEANAAVFQKFGKVIVSFEEWLPQTMLDAAELFWKFGIEGDR
jgi:beta-phosphoglucomutase-like phosphatase (HAD superfamily)